MIGGILFCFALRAPEIVVFGIAFFASSGMLIGGLCAALAATAPWKSRSSNWRSMVLADQLFFVVLTITAVATLFTMLLPEVAEARERARMSLCKNNMWQHSGYHGGEVVYLDDHARVTSVSSRCPLCSASGAPVYFTFESDEDRQAALAGQHFISSETALDASLRLERIHATSKHQRFRVGPGRTQRIWDENGAVIRRKSNEP
jgi:hypothetical protein